MFWWASCISARHAGSFDCLVTSLILITMDTGRGHCAYLQSCKVPNQTHRGKKKNRKMYAIKQIKICAEYRDMLPRPRLDLSGTPGLRPIGLSPGSWQTSLGLGSMSRYSAQILICIALNKVGIQLDVLGKCPVFGSACISVRLNNMDYYELFLWLSSVSTIWSTVIRLGWTRIGLLVLILHAAAAALADCLKYGEVIHGTMRQMAITTTWFGQYYKSDVSQQSVLSITICHLLPESCFIPDQIKIFLLHTFGLPIKGLATVRGKYQIYAVCSEYKN